jgi:predicted negative regulator of RcsB-dependent stress response
VRQGAIDDAIATLRAAHETAPHHLGVLSNLGGLLARQGRHDEALALLRRVLAQSPNSPYAHSNLAVGLRAAGELAAALAHFERAAAFKPDFAEAHRGCGDTLLDLDRLQEAAAAYERAFLLRRDPGRPANPNAPLHSNRSRLRHDAEQFRYLIARGKLPAAFADVAARYEGVAEFLSEPGLGTPTSIVPRELAARIAPTYDRLLYRPTADALPEGALNPGLDVGRIEADYLQNGRGIAWFDGLLSAAALARLLAFAREATVWFHCRYGNGYLGAFFDDGFCCPLLVQIAEELRQALPRIFGRHPLQRLWAFKYDSRPGGIPLHADAAAVNVNFWLTPDEANRDPEGGGLIVWDKRAPADADFAGFVKDESAIRAALQENGARAVAVAYRQNRCVMFNSDLYHETAPLDFREGYENRRLNVTLLYGKRGA